MSTYTWPAAWIPSAFELRVSPNLRTFSGPYTPTLQALDMLGERWTGRLDLPPTVDRIDIGRRLAFFDRLHGRANAFTIPNYDRMQPLGSARGTLTLAASAAQLANTATLTGVRAGQNLLRYSGLESDSNADGLCDGMALYQAGSYSGATYSRVGGTGSSGAWCQRVTATALGGTTADQLGIGLQDQISVTPGVTYTMAADVLATSGTTGVIEIDWYAAGGGFLSRSVSALAGSGVSYQRQSVTAAAPATAAFATIYIYMRANSSPTPELRIDNMQLEAAAAPTAYASGAQFYAGDCLSIGGQFVRLVADAAADDAGQMPIEFQTRLRTAMASGTAVTWSAPTLTVRLKSGDEVPMAHQPGYTEGFSLEFVEVV